jgi:hypothetical protein
MSDYLKSTNFATKDTLPSGNANKIVKGTELDTEFNAIASSSASKADTLNPVFSGLLTTDTLVTTSTANFGGEVSTSANITQSGTGALNIAKGTTGQRPATPTTGALRYNTTLGYIENYTGTEWRAVGYVTPADVSDKVNTSIGQFALPVGNSVQRTSGPINGLLRYNTDTNGSDAGFYEGYKNGQWVKFLTVNEGNYTISYAAIGGGAGGALGGGGGGKFSSGSFVATPTTVISMTIGGGGASGGAGSSSVIAGNVTATGGSAASGSTGGTSGNGYAGGINTGGQGGGSGGGGGATAAGSNGGNASGGNGGAGAETVITGSSVFYGGGGGGYTGNGGTAGAGGSGGGGSGGYYEASAPSYGSGANGTTNTGGGGGGSPGPASPSTSSGGSGRIILSVPTTSYTGTTTGSPVITTSGASTILVYNSSGTYTA